VKDVSVQELKAELDRGVSLRLLDVREPEEVAVSQLPGVLAIPMALVPQRLDEISREDNWVVICRSGGRSGSVTQFLTSQGYANVRNMTGGMRAWAEAHDPGMPVA
jgi:rhodanese-related sulfurtransferase